MMTFILERVGNSVGKGENAGYHNLLKIIFVRIIRILNCIVKRKRGLLTLYHTIPIFNGSGKAEL